MRPEKQYLIKDISEHLDKSDYFFLTNFSGLNAFEAADLRSMLAEQGAEFHVVKNRLLNVALKEREIEGTEDYLAGPTALVVGGSNPSGTAKVIAKFIKEKDKFTWKGGVVGKDIYDPTKIEKLKDLPNFDVLQAQLLGLLNMPAQLLLGTLHASPRDLVSVLSKKPETTA
jgi:large subunit ribosomal protein L10